VWDDGVDDGETGSVDRTVVLAGRTPRPRREGCASRASTPSRRAVVSRRGRVSTSRDAGRVSVLCTLHGTLVTPLADVTRQPAR
jgi:hypothetical protein